MRRLIVGLIFCARVFAAIGDNAPSIPATYVQTHPHLPAPTVAQGNARWAARPTAEGGSNAAAYMWTDATAWSNATPQSYYYCRHLILTTWVENENAGVNAAAYLAKVKGFEPNATAWANAAGALSQGWCDAMAYDYLYSYLNSTDRTNLRNAMYTLESGATGNCGVGGNESGFFINGGLNSPYSDTNYTRMCLDEMILALAVYPDDPANSLPHLRWALDKFLNYDLPDWKHGLTDNRCAGTTDASPNCGAGWINGWGGYEGPVAQQAMSQMVMTDNLAWAVASGIGVNSWFITKNPWLKNFIYWLPYQARPDLTLANILDDSFFLLDREVGTYGARPGYLNETAEVYNDPTARCIARTINNAGAAPNGFEPSAYPYYTPDSSSNTACGTGHQWLGASSSLSPYKDLPGWGTLVMRTGFTEGDTVCWIRYGDGFWDHPKMDTGSFVCDHRGHLAISSGTYASGSGSDHWQNYGAETISQNSLLLVDANDYYGPGGAGGAITTTQQEEYYLWCRNFPGSPLFSSCPKATTFAAPQNDGGQRRIGSAFGNQNFAFNGTNYVHVGDVSSTKSEPADEAMWNRSREWWHRGKLMAWSVGSTNQYAFASIDITAAYNNAWSHNPYNTASLFNSYTQNTTNRTSRARMVRRNFLFIPRGTSAYMYVFDQVNAATGTSGTYYTGITKKFLLHTINRPTVGTPASGTIPFNVARTETVTESDGTDWLTVQCGKLANCNAGHTTYTYNGQMYGWMTWPQTNGGSYTPPTGHNNAVCPAGNFSCINLICGPGHEFDITDSTGSHNHNECMLGLCGPGGISGSVSAASSTFNAGTNDGMSITVDSGSAQPISLTTGLCTSGVACTCATMIGGGNFAGQLTGATASCPNDPFTGNPRLAIQSNNTNTNTALITINATSNT